MQFVLLALVALAFFSSSSFASDTIKSAHEQAVRYMIRTQITPEYFKELQRMASIGAADAFQMSFEPTLERKMSNKELQRLQLFWHEKIQEVMPYKVIEDMAFPIISESMTYEEVLEINDFYRTPTGQKLIKLQPQFIRKAEAAAEELTRRFADSGWVAIVVEDLKVQFPQWFQGQ